MFVLYTYLSVHALLPAKSTHTYAHKYTHAYKDTDIMHINTLTHRVVTKYTDPWKLKSLHAYEVTSGLIANWLILQCGRDLLYIQSLLHFDS